nr:YHS domain-containing (seleno)protein [Allomuricauda sp.]|tara:strand:+ start:3694 stop:4749 length:1056 start_codon:yes stop_codon:yes gene_type:complete
MKILRLLMMVLALFGSVLSFGQSKEIKKYTVQEYVKDRADWKPNLANSEIMVLENGYAIGGYDPVAYFKGNKALKGNESISAKWKNVTWLFSSEEHKKIFEKAPNDYTPQYGGWSIYQMSGNGGEGYATQTRPEDSWLIFDRKLYLVHRADWAEHLRKNDAIVSNLIKYADDQWPNVSEDIKGGGKVFWPSLRPEDPYDSHEMRPILAQTEIMVLHNGYAIGGYDPVAYFEIDEATKGKESISYEWKDAIWLFDSEKHLEMFKDNPEKYAPQYGGWCAYGMSGHGSDGYGAQTRPKDSWSIINGKLYLNWSRGVNEMFLKNKEEYIENADKEWKRVRKELLKGKTVHWMYF